MRVHIHLEEDLLRELDRRVGPRGRSAYIAAIVRQALDEEQRWERIAAAVGTLETGGHEWDDDPAGWVASQRRADRGRVG